MSTISGRVSDPAPTPSDLRPYRHRLRRMVEGQHRISTNRLADTSADQRLLEEMIEEAKPSMPAAARGLHYLLATPFRYGHARPSRFRRAGARPGIFYGAETIRTVVAESAYWRLLFLSRSPGTMLPSTTTEYSAFSVAIAVERALDLTAPPLSAGEAAWTDPNDYRPCQALADQARAIGAQAIRYRSVRDPAGGMNLALLDPAGFRDKAPRLDQTWHFRVESGALVALAAFPATEAHKFRFADFGLSPP
jgi:hypothetical protein